MTTPNDLFRAALARHQAGELDAAEAMYGDILKAAPTHAPALGLLGALLIQRGRYGDALHRLDASLGVEPRQPPAHNNRGYALNKLGRNDEALAAFETALMLKADYAEAHNNRGNALRDLQRHADALADFDRALTLKPDYAEAINNRGSIVHKMGRTSEALTHYERALALKPNFTPAHLNRAAVLMDMGRWDEAGTSYDRAAAIDPACADAHWGKSMWHLLRGEFEPGWRLFEWRWARDDVDPGTRSLRKKLWLGDTPLAGKHVLLYAEQGFGDTIQFARYAQLVRAQAHAVTLVVQPELKTLLTSLDTDCEVRAADELLPAFDLYCPLMSLPLAFGTRLQSIPSRVPYIAAPAEKIAHWRDRLGPRGRPRVGVVWAGRPTHRNDANRSLDARRLQTLAGLDVEFHALQAAVRDGDRAALSAALAMRFHDAELRDFSDTAALIAHMDVVVSVDTSVVHLAGALGKPIWILLPFAPDYRWLLGRDDSPWYPTARLFRQPAPGEWDEPVTRAAAELARLAQQRAAG